MKKTIFLLFAFCFSINSFAQNRVDSLENKYKNVKWPVKNILGTWFSDDSLQTQIEFIRKGNEIIIEPAKHVGNFTFQIEEDSIYASGYAVNWPPYNCILNNVDEKTLEVFYYDLINYSAFRVNYKR